MNKKESRLRRGRQTRAKIAELKANRLSVHRTNMHIYANVIAPDAKILASCSTLEAEVRQELAGKSGKGGEVNVAEFAEKSTDPDRLSLHVRATGLSAEKGIPYEQAVRQLL